jgi:hypothetical protein
MPCERVCFLIHCAPAHKDGQAYFVIFGYGGDSCGRFFRATMRVVEHVRRSRRAATSSSSRSKQPKSCDGASAS